MRRLVILLVAIVVPNAAHAGGTVTLCGSDVQGGAGVNLATAMIGGGVVRFACKAGTTLPITQTHVVSGKLEIDGGNAVTLQATSYRAMFLVSGDLTMRRLALRQPYIGFPTSTGVRGIAAGPGALTLVDVQVRGSGSPFSVETTIIDRCRFENNNTYALVTAGIVTIAHSDFVNNDGAIVLRDNRPAGSGRTTVADITDSRFRGNATAIQWKGRLRVTTSAFDANGKIGRSGGAIRLQGDGAIDHTTFDDNFATEGGAVWLVGGTLSLRRATFRRNVARKDGGAVGVGDLWPGSIVSRYSTFAENQAARGGAIKLASGGATIALQGGPNTFARNTAQRGGAIYSEQGRIQLARAVFTDNTATVDGGAIVGAARGAPLATLLANSLVVRNTAPNGSAFVGSALTLVNSTVASNRGLAIAILPPAPVGASSAWHRLELRNAVISNNQGGNCAPLPLGATLVHNGHDLQYPASECGAAIATADPRLDGLFVPAFGSPAYAGGEIAVCLTAPISAKDIYGAVRPQGDGCAIGAVEGDVDPRLMRLLLGRLGNRLWSSVTGLRGYLR